MANKEFLINITLHLSLRSLMILGRFVGRLSVDVSFSVLTT